MLNVGTLGYFHMNADPNYITALNSPSIQADLCTRILRKFNIIRFRLPPFDQTCRSDLCIFTKYGLILQLLVLLNQKSKRLQRLTN